MIIIASTAVIYMTVFERLGLYLVLTSQKNQKCTDMD